MCGTIHCDRTPTRGARPKAAIGASWCAGCAARRCRLASQPTFCYFSGQEGDAERAHRSRPGRLAQSPRRLEVLAGGGSADHRECEGVFLWHRLQAGALSPLTQQAVGARMRALAGAALPVGCLTAYGGEHVCDSSTRCNSDVSLLLPFRVCVSHTMYARAHTRMYADRIRAGCYQDWCQVPAGPFVLCAAAGALTLRPPVRVGVRSRARPSMSMVPGKLRQPMCARCSVRPATI